MSPIAILYQAMPAPLIDGLQKPMKPGGYSDSGADIAYQLLQDKQDVLTPVDQPHVQHDHHWVFPDTPAGIDHAIRCGAKTFWLNTVLYADHPIMSYYRHGITIVGQDPRSVDLYDDKIYTNSYLKEKGLPIPRCKIYKKQDPLHLAPGLTFPLVVKPVRGRGSQGVVRVNSQYDLEQSIKKIFTDDEYGDTIYVEEFLGGEEITITVLPKGVYRIQEEWRSCDRPHCLPAVKRYNHEDGIAPYNGIVAVIENSRALSAQEETSSHVQEAYDDCIKAAELLNIKAPIRIDCRADERGQYYLFDVNMKPNMTGPSRAHRQGQESLSLIAARKIGWNYSDLLLNILRQGWKAEL